MSVQLAFFASLAFGTIAWGVVAYHYLWPRLRRLDRREALRPLLVLHAFRFVGLAFLVPGVVSPQLPASFAHSAAYGDIVAATLALVSLISEGGVLGAVVPWIFNVWGVADLFTAFYEANQSGLLPGQLGATFFIPTVVVPLLLITHALMLRILLRQQPATAPRESRVVA